MRDLTGPQRDRLLHFRELAQQLNARLNLYSPASAEAFWQRHIVHSLALAERAFPAGSTVVDWGTGGGLPGLPLAILFPEVHFTLVDSVGKKVRAVRTMARRLGLDNVTAWNGRAETWEGRAHYSVSRATSPLATLWGWHERVALPLDLAASGRFWPPGLLCLKGGAIEPEIADLLAGRSDLHVERMALEPLLHDPYFRTKALISVFREPSPGA